MAGKVFDLEKYKSKAREAAAEGFVLLKNDNEALPLEEGCRIALFGRSQYNYYKSGTGSGGMVNTAYVTGVKEALEQDGRFPLSPSLKSAYDEWIKDHPFNKGQGWASEPWHQEEMPVTEELAKKAALEADAAIVLIGRTAGEDQDNSAEKGSFLLTDDEEAMLSEVTKAFSRVIVLLNVGNIIDMKWVGKYNPSAVAYIWQGGQEGGNGVLDVLSGKAAPSGHLSDTIAYDITDYPSTKNFGGKEKNIYEEDIYVGYRYFETFAEDKVLYPFGYGLSYTTFAQSPKEPEVVRGSDAEGDFRIVVPVLVENTGKYAGKETVQVYMEAPQGKLGKPARVLTGFAKTKVLSPGEKTEVSVSVPALLMASYDDSGKTGYKSAFVLEAGAYTFYAGDNVRSAQRAGSVHVPQIEVISQLSEAMAPRQAFDRMIPEEKDGKFSISYESVPLSTISGQKKRAENLPANLPQTGDRGIRLRDAADGKARMEDFIAQLSTEDLACIVRGEGMSSPKVTPGTGGAIGGVTDELLHFGIPIACVSDGPSGIRMDSGNIAFAMPNGTLLACTWNEQLQEELYQFEGLELRKDHIDALLGPGMNLHRNPLNGRNFEYFSEDPLLTGKCAAAQLRGMQKYGVTGVIKHFALNTQESGRNSVEQVASERAIRELYLRGFEIAVKEGGASAIMTMYGPVNGFWCASNYDLVTQILRQEWGFTGIVMTDWWAKANDEGGPGDYTNEAAMIRAQNDLNMVTSSSKDNTTHDNSLEALKAGTVTIGEYQRSAENICRWLVTKPSYLRFTDQLTDLDRELDSEKDPEESAFDRAIPLKIANDGKPVFVDPALIDTSRNSANIVNGIIQDRGLYSMTMKIRAKTENELAQIPMSLFRDGKLIKMVTLTGADKEWQEITVDLGLVTGNFYLKVYFAQDGMEIGSWSFVMTQSLEEKIKAAIAGMQVEK